MSEEQQLIAGRYQLGDLIGRGGMGDVYKGVDATTGGEIAAKLLHDAIIKENPDIVDRFEREGEALRRLNHPNIVTILDTVEDGGRHYLIMEYVSGGSLRDLLDEESRLPIEAVLNVALDLCDALTRAHRLDIVHRDIKPDNVLLAEDGTPRLTDFGVAHLGGRTRLTATGSVIGTYAYLSPEACNGEELDERADIWSFGVMLFEMLTGRVPFNAQSTAAVLTAILTKPAPDLAVLRPNTPRALQDLIYRMLEKDRARRISSIRLVGAELEALIRGVDTPFRDKLMETGYLAAPVGSRFATPSSERSDIPAMVRSTPEQTHGLSLYPGQQYPVGSYIDPARTTQTLATSRWPWLALTLSVTVIACAIVLVVAIVFGPDSLGTGGGGSSGEHTPDGAFVLLNVDPVADDEYMVLVADFEPLSTDPRDVSRFVVEDLTLFLDTNVPFSNLRVRQYPAVIQTAAEARAAAEANHAAVVVWGSYTAAEVDVAVDIGDLSVFPYNEFDRVLLERTLNVRVELTDERRQSVAPVVLTTINALFNADGDAYEAMRTGVIIDLLPEEATLTVSGSSVAALVHRAGLTGDAESLAFIEQALELDAANPLLLLQSTVIKQRLGDFEGALTDARTAERIGPEKWAMPKLMTASMAHDESVLTLFADTIEMRPDDWFLYFFRGTVFYSITPRLPQFIEMAKADLNTSIELGPEASFPYIYNALMALHEGRMTDAADVIDLVITKYPDPSVMERMIRATFAGGGESLSPYEVTLSAFTNQVLGRYDDVIDWTARGLALYPEADDMLLLQGAAYCGLGEYGNAEASFSDALAVDPDFTLVYLLRADARLQQADTAGADYDFSAVETGAQSAVFEPYVAAVRAGQLTCATFLSPENPLFAMATGSLPATGDTPTPIPFVHASATPDPAASVEPVAAGTYMVLVADFEPVGGAQPRDVARFITDDLQVTLEDSVSYDALRVRRYPAIITSNAAAAAAAAATGASVVVWGNYDPEIVEVQVQVGALDAFQYNQFDRAEVAELANVRVLLTNERRQSIAVPVVSVVNVLSMADGDQFKFLMMLSIIDELTVTSGEIMGSTVGSHIHRALLVYLDDTVAAVEEFSAAQVLDQGNALIFMYQALAQLRLGNYAQSLTDVQTAARLGPVGWTAPDYFTMEETLDAATASLNRVIDSRPDDWYPFFMSGVMLYLDMGDPAAAQVAIARSLELAPEANLPYILEMLIALYQGRIPDAQTAANFILTEFPDPHLTNRAFSTLYGEGANPETMIGGQYFELGANSVLGQYAAVVATVEAVEAAMSALNAFPTDSAQPQNIGWSDMLLLEGLAYCNLGEYDLAEDAFDQALKYNENHSVAHLLRGQMRLKLADTAGSEADFSTARTHAWGDAFDPWVAAAIAGDWTCENFFEYKP